jgi:hypothetical protein
MNPIEVIGKLQSARQNVMNTLPANPEQVKAKQSLVDSIEKRIKLCERDLELRRAYADSKLKMDNISVSIAQSEVAINEHDELKKYIYSKYQKRPLSLSDLSTEDRDSYEVSRKKRDDARRNKSNQEKARADVEKIQKDLKLEHVRLRQSAAVGGKLPQTPTDSVCVPCIEEQVRGFKDKQRRQNGGKKVYPGAQKYGNCGIQSSNQLIAAKTGSLVDEKKLLEKSIKDRDAEPEKPGEGDFGRGGTGPVGRQNILLKSGDIKSRIDPTTPKNLADAIKANKGIVVNVDAGVLWDKSDDIGQGHAIVVYDGDFDDDGNLTHVYINDTGSNQQGRRMTINEFMAAADLRNPSSMNVTEDPIW